MNLLMVCMGNICRSPMAEGIARDCAQKASLPIHIDSAGTHAYHIGQPPDPRAQSIMRHHGHDISNLRARVMTASDIKTFDHIMVADTQNLRNVQALATTDTQRQKIVKMLHYLPEQPNADVIDPYYGDDTGFEQVYQQLYRAINHYLSQL